MSYADDRARRRARRRAFVLYAELAGYLILCWAVVAALGYGIYRIFT